MMINPFKYFRRKEQIRREEDRMTAELIAKYQEALDSYKKIIDIQKGLIEKQERLLAIQQMEITVLKETKNDEATNPKSDNQVQ